ncbi:LysR substrate-binding domain-containing protein [Streptomyces sp. NPDC003077]|uniref:LysR substrate-binding domain-containing protein n=1 Tax=Streptomyces sp. NPDC003077 TaxID=3154443 RepID=UPI0033BB0C1D
MTLDDLRAFVAVCDAGSLSAVARDLGCTQSAVSQRIKRLERETGMDLLERRPRGVAPTQAGRVLRRAAADSISGLDLALRHLADMRAGHGGTLRITTGATTVRHFLSTAVVDFRRRHPKVNLEFHTENSSRRCFTAVADGTAELAWITIGPPVRGIEQHPVMELPWVLAVRTDDPLSARARIEPAELARIPHIRLPEDSTSRMRLDGHLWRQEPADGRGMPGSARLSGRHAPIAASGTPASSPVSAPSAAASGTPAAPTGVPAARSGVPAPVASSRPSAITPPGVAAPNVDGTAGTASVADWDTALLLAELGVGHAVVPRLPGWREEAHPTLRLVPIPSLPPLAAGWAVRQWAALSPVAVEFAETVNACLREGA